MKSTDFMDEWNRTHPSSPSYQDVLDWAERKQAEEMKELNNEWRVTLALQKQVIIQKSCQWLEAYIACGVSPEGTYAFVAKFRKAMEE